jgi:DNA-binding Lrp family transcriptional regulator
MLSSFWDRQALLDDVSVQFLRVLDALGGYCAVAQAKALRIGSSEREIRARLKGLERLGFLRRVTIYPVVYQITKSVTRLLGRDSSSRRRHTLATVRARVLAMTLYLEAREWPAEFEFDDERKITTFIDAGCPLGALPRRGGRPYLREHFVLWLPDGRIGVAMVDQPYPSPLSQLRNLIRQFLPLLRILLSELDLLIVTGDKGRCHIYERLLAGHPAIQKLGLGEYVARIKPIWVRSPAPKITELIWPRPDIAELFLEPHGTSRGLATSTGTKNTTASQAATDARAGQLPGSAEESE